LDQERVSSLKKERGSGITERVLVLRNEVTEQDPFKKKLYQH